MCNIQNNHPRKTVNFAKDNKMVTETLDIVTVRVVKYMIAREITLSTAESCTGGLLSERITSVDGASKIFLGGVCSYSEDMKQRVLGVSAETLKKYTVYSAETASEMSGGVMKLTGSNASISVTGIAGPTGGTKERPVGTVYVSVRYGGEETVRNLALYKEYEYMDRNFIRNLTALRAFEMLEALIARNDTKAED